MRVAVAFTLLLVVACAGDDTETVQPYDRAPVPAVPDRTKAIDPNALADGDYWAEAIAVGSGRPIIVFELAQASFVDDEFVIDDEPSATVTVPWDDLRSVTVVAATRQNYAVPGAELASLIAGNPPSAEAPDDFVYTPYPFVVTVRRGTITEAYQIWLP